jgi:hypothetical protein
MKSILFIITCLSTSLVAIGQTGMYTETFDFSYLPKKNGGQFLYNGTAHSFTLDIVSDSINTVDFPNYIKISDRILQTSIVPLPASNLDLNRLTIAQQKEALEAYVNYELAYFKNDLKLSYKNLRKEWMTINTKLWLFWIFDVYGLKKDADLAEQVKGQAYASTICFNQILDLNMPLFQGDPYEKTKKLVIKLMATLKTYNHHQY